MAARQLSGVGGGTVTGAGSAPVVPGWSGGGLRPFGGGSSTDGGVTPEGCTPTSAEGSESGCVTYSTPAEALRFGRRHARLGTPRPIPPLITTK